MRRWTEGIMMTDNDYFHENNPTITLRVWVLGHMLWGAFISAIVVTAIVGTMVAIWFVGEFLPEESKQAPSPYGSLETVQADRVA